jgi:hypothetical protein
VWDDQEQRLPLGGGELKRLSLLSVIPVRERQPGEGRRVGYRNARNIFEPRPFEQKVLELHITIERDRVDEARLKRARTDAVQVTKEGTP